MLLTMEVMLFHSLLSLFGGVWGGKAIHLYPSDVRVNSIQNVSLTLYLSRRVIFENI